MPAPASFSITTLNSTFYDAHYVFKAIKKCQKFELRIEENGKLAKQIVNQLFWHK